MSIVQLTTLGRNGRFGNQLFQAAFARAYAEKYGATLQIPGDWIGRELFDGWDFPTPDRELPRMPLDVVPWGEADIDLYGFFQNQESMNILSRAKLREWFTFKPEVLAAHRQWFTGPYAAAHVRQGDYVGHPLYCEVSEASYSRAHRQSGEMMPLVWIREGDGRDWFDDFLFLMRAPVLFRANSTFSWWAATLGPGRVFSPVVEARTGPNDVEFVEGNWPRFCDSANVGATVADLHLPE